MGGTEGAALNLQGGGNEHACRQLCMPLCAAESERGNELVANCVGMVLLGVRSRQHSELDPDWVLYFQGDIVELTMERDLALLCTTRTVVGKVD